MNFPRKFTILFLLTMKNCFITYSGNNFILTQVFNGRRNVNNWSFKKILWQPFADAGCCVSHAPAAAQQLRGRDLANI
jgi:hypothetical protein